MADTPGSSPSLPPSPLDRLVQQYLDHKKSGAHPLGRVQWVKAMVSFTEIPRLELARKLGENPSQISEMAKFADFPDPVRETLISKKVSYRALREISSLDVDDQTQLAKEIESGKVQVQEISRRVEEMLRVNEERKIASNDTLPSPPSNGDTPPAGVRDTPKELVSLPKAPERSAPLVEAEGSGYPLIRDTVNALTKTLWWVKDAHFGELAERWLLHFDKRGWIKTGLKALVLVFAVYGVWHTAYEIHFHWTQFWSRFKSAAFQSRSETSSAAPHIVDSHTVERHRLELKWTAVAGAGEYKVYWHTPDDSSIEPLGDDVTSLGAVVDVTPSRKQGYITVKGIGPGDIESEDSEKIAFAPNGENYTDTVEPLPPSEQDQTAVNGNSGQRERRLTGGAASGNLIKKENHSPTSPLTEVSVNRSSRQPPPAAAQSLAAPSSPVGVFFNSFLKNGDSTLASAIPNHAAAAGLIAMKNAGIAASAASQPPVNAPSAAGAAPAPAVTLVPVPSGLTDAPLGHQFAFAWDSLGSVYRYNLYYLITGQASAPIKMNAAPLAATKFAWTPSDPGGVYEVYVTAVDPQGRESAPSKSRTNIKFPAPQTEGPGG